MIATSSINYHDLQDISNMQKLKELTTTLPDFCMTFFRGISDYTSTRTRLSYAYDIKLFFDYMHENKEEFKRTEIKECDILLLNTVTRIDIENYIEYCSYYTKDNKTYVNGECGKARKIASLRSFYNYFYQNELIEKNPAILVPMPKMHEKEIVRLDKNEMKEMINVIESGESLSQSEKKFHSKTKNRDICIVTLLLLTGMRVSECVGIDIKDIDFNNNAVKIRRKGGSESVLYFGKEVEKAINEYMKERIEIIPEKGHENALFLSLQKKRITVRAVEKLVKKYAALVTSIKKITPHKLRSTYGTSLYRETGDIYLVADVLGHKNVNTTRKHYAAIEDERRRKAANVVRLK